MFVGNGRLINSIAKNTITYVDNNNYNGSDDNGKDDSKSKQLQQY